MFPPLYNLVDYWQMRVLLHESDDKKNQNGYPMTKANTKQELATTTKFSCYLEWHQGTKLKLNAGKDNHVKIT